MENEKNRLHEMICQKMAELGGVSPETFRLTVQEDPQLIVSYLQAMDIDAEKAEIIETGEDNVRLCICLKAEEEPKYARVFFTGAKGTAKTR